MDREALVVNFFFTFRVFVVGGILYFLPRISRKGLVFGTYVGESSSAGEAARELQRRWDLGCALCMALSLAVGYSISLSGWPVTGNLTGTAVLLLSAPVLYLWMHRKSRDLPSPGASKRGDEAVATLVIETRRGERLAKVAIAFCITLSLGTMAYLSLVYASLPDDIPGYAQLLGLRESTTPKSVTQLMYVPAFSLVFSTGFALIGLMIAHAKRSLRGGTGGRSLEAQDAFRTANARTFAGGAIAIATLLCTMAVQPIRALHGSPPNPEPRIGMEIGVLSLIIVIYMATCLVRIMRVYGQGGAHKEVGSEEAPLEGSLADNSRWLWGVFYFDRDDPSLLVESRFGLGYTMNLGNPRSVAFTGVYLALLIGLGLLVVQGAVS